MSELYPTGAIKASRFYVHTSYVPTYYYAYISLEEWISTVIFRKDISRVFMASDDYAFRRRFELTDMSQDYEQLEASSLRFPFANYNILNQGWQKDEREAANTAAQVYAGLYVGTTKLQAAAVTTEIPVQFYFDREDDARFAYDRLFFFSFNPHYYKASVPYSNNTLEIPYTFEFEDLSFNPNFTESDWLKQNRIFVISVKFKVSSYIILPPNQPDWNATQEEIDTFDDGIENYILTEDVILDFWSRNTDLQVMNYQGVEAFPYKGEEGVVYVDTLCQDEDKGFLENPKVRRCNIYLWDPMSESYVQVDPHKYIDISVDSIGVNGALISGSVPVKLLKVESLSDTSATLAWAYDTGYDIAGINKITVSVNSTSPEIEVPIDSLTYTLTKLTDATNYLVYVNFYSVDGTVKKLHITFTTRPGASVKAKTLPKNALVGLKWEV